MSPWLIALAAVIVAAGALVPLLGRRKRLALRSNDEAIAARSSHAKLGHYVETPAATDDVRAAELLRDARERWVTAGSVLTKAKTEEDFELAERICVEGLAAVAKAHERIGIPGPKGD
ncbi:hypothetical protein EV193_106105 [Herbihabitans rhizosphaerae]|uniref:Uncharacterized protein n=1 Tax=Herbihabitans rhizosphaerae TaxID=1872711 RepID=A0A4Q7KMP8_9PSEU|nr:hypothetical protein [Herbihabitans rhizosphaerae]RZS36871.1 hypothetical protein EV193_106105 [Herbihabitans rhizosphaerae]